MASLIDLPADVMLDIFRYLVPTDILNLSLTCKHLYSLTSEDIIWNPYVKHILEYDVEKSCLRNWQQWNFRLANYNHLIKMKIVGDPGTGVFELHDRIRPYFSKHTGANFVDHVVSCNEKIVKLRFWASTTRTHSISEYRGPSCFFVLFDITNSESFQKANYWLQAIEIYSLYNVKAILVGNKCDFDKQRAVDYNTAKEFADKFGIPYVEISALRGQSILELLKLSAQIVLTKKEEKSAPNYQVEKEKICNVL